MMGNIEARGAYSLHPFHERDPVLSNQNAFTGTRFLDADADSQTPVRLLSWAHRIAGRIAFFMIDPAGDLCTNEVRENFIEKDIEAVRQWRFRPGTQNGDPVDVALTIEVNFNLR